MATKKIFSIDGATVSNTISSLFKSINKTRFKLMSKSGKSIINMPLVFAIILGVIFPFLTIALVIIALTLSYTVSIEQEKESETILIDRE